MRHRNISAIISTNFDFILYRTLHFYSTEYIQSASLIEMFSSWITQFFYTNFLRRQKVA